jgi:hypothetical protein
MTRGVLGDMIMARFVGALGTNGMIGCVHHHQVPVTVGNRSPMSEAIKPEQRPYPGEAWTEIVRRPTLEEFSRAFASDVVLEASVLSLPIVGPAGLWAFFQATRAMYERVSFTHEIGTKARMCLEWEGVFAGNPVAGATVITRDDRGAITSVRLHHRPFDQVVAFAETISRRLG